MRVELIGSSNLYNKIKGNASRQLTLGNSLSYLFRTRCTVALHGLVVNESLATTPPAKPGRVFDWSGLCKITSLNTFHQGTNHLVLTVKSKLEHTVTRIHIYFLSELSAWQISLMAYLSGYNLGCLDKNAEL